MEQQERQEAQQDAHAAVIGAASPPADTLSPPAVRSLAPDVLRRVASFLPTNEVPFGLRLVSKAFAAALHGPEHTTLRLSQPAAPSAYQRRWAGPDALRALARAQREQLPLLTARSGVIPNVQTLQARGDVQPLCRPPDEWATLIKAAAGAGQLELCRWLHSHGCPATLPCLRAAARSGHADVCAWLLTDGGCEWSLEAAIAAMRGGHVKLGQWLLGCQACREKGGLSSFDACTVLEAAAEGCPLDTLQRLHAQFSSRCGGVLDIWPSLFSPLTSAVCSPCADWKAKVVWIEGLGAPQSDRATASAARAPKGEVWERLSWLLERGYRPSSFLAAALAESGDVRALKGVLSSNVALCGRDCQAALSIALRHGHLAFAKLLLGSVPGVVASAAHVEAAAEGGHLPVVAWLAGLLGGARSALGAAVFTAAVSSSSMDLVEWLAAKQCPLSRSTFKKAAICGSEAAMERLMQLGCPVRAGEPFIAAALWGDVYALHALRRVGCPGWGSATFEAALEEAVVSGRGTAPLAALLGAGMPVDWDAVAVQAERLAANGALDAHEWVREQRRAREAAGGTAAGC